MLITSGLLRADIVRLRLTKMVARRDGLLETQVDDPKLILRFKIALERAEVVIGVAAEYQEPIYLVELFGAKGLFGAIEVTHRHVFLGEETLSTPDGEAWAVLESASQRAPGH